MPTWKPRLTLQWVVCTLFATGVLFLCLGAPLTKASNDAVYQTLRYDNLQACRDAEGGGECVVDMVVEEDMEAPLFLYYRLTSFHQNHRRYVKSRSDIQLRGDEATSAELRRDCDPLVEYGDAYGGRNASLRGKYLYPCGLVANSMFTDVFRGAEVRRASGGGFTPLAAGSDWLETGIAWSTDLGKKFSPMEVDPDEFTSESPRGFTLPPVQDEHFVVWMRSASEPSFNKLYARLPHTSLAAGDVLRLRVVNSYPTSFFDGTKSLVLSRTTWAGSRDPFLGPAYLFYAFLCFALAGAFVLRARYVESETSSRAHAHVPFGSPYRGAATTPSVLEADVPRGGGTAPRSPVL